MAGQIALDVTGRWVEKLFHHTNMAGFSCYLWTIESATLRALPLPLETGKSNTFNQKAIRNCSGLCEAGIVMSS
jgi:hypothetical protein